MSVLKGQKRNGFTILFSAMLLGDSTVGNTTVGFSSTQADLAFDSTSTSSGTITGGVDLVFASSATSTATINKQANLTLDVNATGSATFGSTKGVNLSFDVLGPTLGDDTLGSRTLGVTSGERPISTSNIVFGSTKGITQSLTASATSGLSIFRRIDLALASVATSSVEYNIIKGVEVQFDSQTNTTLVLVPDFDELIGRSRADSDRSLVVRADSDRTLIVRADANLN